MEAAEALFFINVFFFPNDASPEKLAELGESSSLRLIWQKLFTIWSLS